MVKVLIIEDNTEIRENTAEMLGLEGFKVFIADNGSEGIEVARQKSPDVILCDIMMPGKNGYEVCTSLRQDPGTSHIPFIFISARSESRDIRAGLDLGACAYLSKPFEFEELIRLINQSLNR